MIKSLGAEIRSAAEGSYVWQINLRSPGGDISEALAISDYLNDKLITASVPVSLADLQKAVRDEQRRNVDLSDLACTHPKPKNPSNCVCNSACAVIWLSAPDRSGTLVGIHRPRFGYEEFAGLTPTQAEEKYNQLLEGLSQYLRQHDVPAAIIAKMLTVSSSENYLLSTEEVQGIGMRPYLSELLNARCAKFYGSLAFQEWLETEIKEKEESWSSDPSDANFNAWQEALKKSDYRVCKSRELWKMRAEKQGVELPGLPDFSKYGTPADDPVPSKQIPPLPRQKPQFGQFDTLIPTTGSGSHDSKVEENR